VNEYTSYNVDWDEELNYKGMSKIQVKGIDMVNMIEEMLGKELKEISYEESKIMTLDESIKYLTLEDKILTDGWERALNLEQLILCLVDKIKKDYC